MLPTDTNMLLIVGDVDEVVSKQELIKFLNDENARALFAKKGFELPRPDNIVLCNNYGNGSLQFCLVTPQVAAIIWADTQADAVRTLRSLIKLTDNTTTP